MNLQTVDPLQLAGFLWPDVQFYKEQVEIIYSVRDNDETFVPAGNMLGKDFVAGFIALWFFLTRHPCRIVTTSVKDDHLRVLWGEMGRFIQTSAKPLDSRMGGPLVINHRELKKVVDGKVDALSYLIGRVAETAEAMQGHHIAKTNDGVPRALFIADEASGVPDEYHKMASTWFHRSLIIGNTWPTTNFFYRGVKKGSVKATGNGHYYQRVIHIKGEHSPNVRYALNQIQVGQGPTNEIIVPGVLPYSEYVKRRTQWNKIEQSVSLDAEFPEGEGVYLFPKEWLKQAAERAQALEGSKVRSGRITMGVDTAMGGDNTSWVVGDGTRVLALVGHKTPDTNQIIGETLALMRTWNVPPEDVLFDYGGGGKVHVDRLRAMGFPVRSVQFGVPAKPEPKRGLTTLDQRGKQEEVRYAYKNRRAEMYGMLRERLDPTHASPYAIPEEILDRPRADGGPSLRDQLTPIPLWYDEEGRIYLPPKQRKPGQDVDPEKPTLIELVGCSPDEADALVLMIYGQFRKSIRSKATASY